MSIQRLAVRDGFPDNAPDELEVHQVVRVNVRHRIGLEGSTVRCGDEQRVVLVEDIPREDGVPVDFFQFVRFVRS